MIEIKNIKKEYEGGEALRGVNLKIHTGEICVVAGGQGSGRTTLADIVSGCMEADGGEVFLCGASLSEQPGEAKTHLGYAPAKPALYPDMTPRAIMKFSADARGMSGREAGDHIDEAVRRFNLKDAADTPVKHLSEGVRRMVSLAQATFSGAECVIIDEPTEGLNPREVLEVRKAIQGIRQGHSVLVTSSNASEIAQIADRVALLEDGKIVAQGKPEDLNRLRADTGTLRLVVKGVGGAVKDAIGRVGRVDVEQLEALEGDCFEVEIRAQDGRDIREESFKALSEAGLTLLEMAPGTRGVEDILVNLKCDRLVWTPEKEDGGDEGNL